MPVDEYNDARMLDRGDVSHEDDMAQHQPRQCNAIMLAMTLTGLGGYGRGHHQDEGWTPRALFDAAKVSLLVSPARQNMSWIYNRVRDRGRVGIG